MNVASQTRSPHRPLVARTATADSTVGLRYGQLPKFLELD
mgnify:FL=1|jgi:hypothetical protein